MMDSSNLKSLLLEYGKLSVGQLQILTQEDPDDLQFLIDQWLHKGRIEVAPEEELSCSSGCSGCNIKTENCGPTVYYQWK